MQDIRDHGRFKSVTCLLALASVVLGSSFVRAPVVAEVLIEQTKPVTAKTSMAQAKFALRLITKLGSQSNRSVIVSPVGLASAFSVLDAGADDTMKAALVKTLGFDVSSDASDSFAGVREATRLAVSQAPDLVQSASVVVLAPSSHASDQTREILKAQGVMLEDADLAKPETRTAINQWIKDKTKGQIEHGFERPSYKVSLAVINALHLKAKWHEPFDSRLTIPADFHLVGGDTAKVPMMHHPSASFAMKLDDRFVGIDLPFSDPRYSMTIVTSRDKPAPVAAFGQAAGLLAGEGFLTRQVDLTMPKLKGEAHQSLLPTLDGLGLRPARIGPRALAGFGPGTRLTEVQQIVSLKTDEEGAEASAATMVLGERGFNGKPYPLLLDKPFVFAIREQVSGMILVVGYVAGPDALLQ